MFDKAKCHWPNWVKWASSLYNCSQTIETCAVWIDFVWNAAVKRKPETFSDCCAYQPKYGANECAMGSDSIDVFNKWLVCDDLMNFSFFTKYVEKYKWRQTLIWHKLRMRHDAIKAASDELSQYTFTPFSPHSKAYVCYLLISMGNSVFVQNSNILWRQCWPKANTVCRCFVNQLCDVVFCAKSTRRGCCVVNFQLISMTWWIEWLQQPERPERTIKIVEKTRLIRYIMFTFLLFVSSQLFTAMDTT